MLLHHAPPAVTACFRAGPADSQQNDHAACSQCMSSSIGAYTSVRHEHAQKYEQRRRALTVLAMGRMTAAAQVAGRPLEALCCPSWHVLCLRDGGHQAVAVF